MVPGATALTRADQFLGHAAGGDEGLGRAIKAGAAAGAIAIHEVLTMKPPWRFSHGIAWRDAVSTER